MLPLLVSYQTHVNVPHFIQHIQVFYVLRFQLTFGLIDTFRQQAKLSLHG